MNPIAFSIFGIDVRWYGILIATGITVGMFIAQFNCKWRDINYEALFDVVLVSLPIGIVGARLYYVIFQFSNYKNNLIDIFNIRQGGLAIHGGILFGVTSAIIFCRYKKINFLKLSDAAAPSIIIAQSFGRWGNFFNQEAHGGVVSYDFIKHFPAFIQKGMYIDGSYYHPTFLYESIWDFTVFILLMIILRKTKKKGSVFFAYLGLYSMGRFFIEGLRTDSLMLGPFRIAQIISVFGIMISVVFFTVIKSKKLKKISCDK